MIPSLPFAYLGRSLFRRGNRARLLCEVVRHDSHVESPEFARYRCSLDDEIARNQRERERD